MIMMENMKGLIPAAGMGSRLKPYTNAIPKELLPVGGKAVIEHVIYQLADAFKVLINRGRNVVFRDIPGYHIDVGTPEDLREANRLYYLREV